MNPSDPDQPTPTVADEVSTVVDDEEVISKTLPSARRPARLTDQACHALSVTREQTIKHPIQAVLIAAVAGAALSALAIAWMLDCSFPGGRRETPVS